MFNIKKITDPWITDEILEVLFEKDRLLNKAKRTKTDDDWTAAILARNEANLLIRNSKADFIKENLEIHKNDSKTFWENINTILRQKNNKKTNIITLTNDAYETITDNVQASNFMNKFFVIIWP